MNRSTTKKSRPKANNRSRQLGFEILDIKSIKHFGGAYLKNSHAKTKRPLTTKRSLHLVMRSSLAKGANSFLNHDKKIQQILSRQARRFGVKIYRMANAGNHLHMIILPQSRAAFNGFIRAISGLIARAVLGVEKGAAKKLQFWDKRPFTRIIEWGREFKSVSNYLMQNTLEALGFIAYQSRTQKLILVKNRSSG